MAKERRDSKNRLLGKGEYQKEDGRYMYRYTDVNGITRYVYSWTLVKSDRVPKGKQSGPCLRDIEKQIAKDLSDGIDSYNAAEISLNDYFDKYMSQKRGIKESTRMYYLDTYDRYVRSEIGRAEISKFKYSMLKQYYNNIMEKHDLSIGTMNSINTVLKPVFKMAVRDNLIRSNPIEGVLTEITKESNSAPQKREALTRQQQNVFIEFVKNSRVYSKWANMLIVMLGTGCRIGETCGLTWDDCDFTNNVIYVRRTLYYLKDRDTGRRVLVAGPPKSRSGIRSIPMLQDVKDALNNERTRQIKEGFSTQEIGDARGFIFCNKHGNAHIPDTVNNAIHNAVAKYNSLETATAKENGRTPVLIPDFSSHVLRHTFCTRLCEDKIDVKVLQSVMGHAKVSTTLDIYTSVTEEFKTEAFQQLQRGVKIV